MQIRWQRVSLELEERGLRNSNKTKKGTLTNKHRAYYHPQPTACKCLVRRNWVKDTWWMKDLGQTKLCLHHQSGNL